MGTRIPNEETENGIWSFCGATEVGLFRAEWARGTSGDSIYMHVDRCTWYGWSNTLSEEQDGDEHR